MIKPILFNTDMVRALQANIKAATRRPVRPRYCDSVFEMFRDELCEASPYKPPRNNGDGTTTRFVRQFVPCKPPYRPGDILYVRETWRRQPLKWSREGGYSDFVLQYRADFTDEEDDCYGRRGGIMPQKWRPSIHMPREAARIFLWVTDVRAERLFDSFTAQGDTIAAIQDEGIDIGEHCRQCIENYGNPCCNDLDPELEPDENGEDENGGSECGILDEVRGKFADLWDRCYAAPRPVKGNGGVIDHYESYPWADINETRTYKGKPWYVMGNPWVWVIEFERVGREEALAWAGGK